jgi:hypothetical protein
MGKVGQENGKVGKQVGQTEMTLAKMQPFGFNLNAFSLGPFPSVLLVP